MCDIYCAKGRTVGSIYKYIKILYAKDCNTLVEHFHSKFNYGCYFIIVYVPHYILPDTATYRHTESLSV